MHEICRGVSKPENLKISGGLVTGILVQYSDLMAQLGVLHDGDEELWDLLMWSLKQKSGVQRKKGLHILEGIVSAMPEDKSLGWKYFLQLYHAIDDTSVHLFQASWDVIHLLHPESGHERLLPFRWILFIWELGIMHRQPTCNKSVILSFLTRNWSNEDLLELTPEFLENVLIPYLGQGSLAKGVNAPEIQSAIPDFFAKWAKALDQNVFILLEPIMKYLSGPHSQAHVLLFGIKVIDAVTSTMADGSIEVSETLKSNISNAFSAQNVIGANFVGIQVQSSLVGVLPLTVVGFSEESLDWILECFKAMPKALVQPGGSLHDKTVYSISKIIARISDKSYVSQVMKNKMSTIIETPRQEFKAFTALSQSFAKVLLVLGEADESVLTDILDVLDTRIKSKTENWTFGLVRLIHDMMDASIALNDRPPWYSNLSEWILARNMLIAIGNMDFFRLLGILKTIKYDGIISYHQSCNVPQEIDNLALETKVDADFAENREASAISIQNLGSLLEIIKQQERRNPSGKYSQTEAYVASFMSEVIGKISALSDDIIQYNASICTSSECMESDIHIDLKRTLLDECKLILARLTHASFDCLCNISLDVRRRHDGILLATSKLLDFAVLMLHDQYKSTMDNSVLRSPSPNNTKKRSKKVYPLSLEKWRTLLCWRMMDRGLSYASQTHFINLLNTSSLASIISFGMSCLTTVSDGNLIILPILHCIAFSIPRMVGEWDVFKEPLVVALEHVGMQGFMISTASDAIKAIGRILISLLMGQSRKKSGITAAILKTCIHPQLFCGDLIALPEVLQMHQDGGSLQDLVQALVNIGCQYNRLLVYLSLHLSSLLALEPRIGICYGNVLVSMSLLGFTDQANIVILVSSKSCLPLIEYYFTDSRHTIESPRHFAFLLYLIAVCRKMKFWIRAQQARFQK